MTWRGKIRTLVLWRKNCLFVCVDFRRVYRRWGSIIWRECDHTEECYWALLSYWKKCSNSEQCDHGFSHYLWWVWACLLFQLFRSLCNLSSMLEFYLSHFQACACNSLLFFFLLLLLFLPPPPSFFSMTVLQFQIVWSLPVPTLSRNVNWKAVLWAHPLKFLQRVRSSSFSCWWIFACSSIFYVFVYVFISLL